jgi:hypothetical protein
VPSPQGPAAVLFTSLPEDFPTMQTGQRTSGSARTRRALAGLACRNSFLEGHGSSLIIGAHRRTALVLGPLRPPRWVCEDSCISPRKATEDPFGGSREAPGVVRRQPDQPVLAVGYMDAVRERKKNVATVKIGCGSRADRGVFAPPPTTTNPR